eukprot:TRINITY_DN22571_c0_g1_i1.p1 TRINITY_DN22571_c0_g1~~TRINITY_DN22571_c0_g1_i1.p1  ORF type:complete len:262 (+),score=45.90 TRINITY_DN22571_c0_g1_i1:2-787(+)
MDIIPVTKLERIEPEQFVERFQNKRPVLITKGLKDWEAIEKWTPDYLKNLPLAENFTVFTSKDNTHFLDNNVVSDRIELSWKESIERILHINSEDSNRLYMRAEIPETLWNDIQTTLPFLSSEVKFKKETMRIWIGTKGNVTPLHYDRCHGLLAQVIGSKKFVLFAPPDTRNLYPYESTHVMSHASRVNLQKMETNKAEELKSYPKFKNIEERYEVVVEPGNVLYTPPGWWHDVTSLTDGVSITLPWDLSLHENVPAHMIN